jgi:hypothetical protein
MAQDDPEKRLARVSPKRTYHYCICAGGALDITCSHPIQRLQFCESRGPNWKEPLG